MFSEKWNLDNINKIKLNDKYTKILLNYILDDFKNLKNDRKTFLTLCDWSYPNFTGGGEKWLYDLSKKMYEFGYNSIIITFIDKDYKYFKKLKIIEKENVKIVEMVNDKIDLIKLIKFLEPVCVSHQGINRIKYMKLCNVLNIPFISGFCFWQDIIDFKDYSNINILETCLHSKSKNFELVYNNCDYLYSASYFVKKVIKQYYNVDIPVIDTISLNNIKTEINEDADCITMININYYKGGWMLINLLEKLDIDCPFILIDSEKNDNKFYNELNKVIEKRNNKYNSKVLLIREKVDDITEIYKKTKLLLIGSMVDETFCRVGYEGMINKIPILSTKNGNLKYLLEDYADFLDENVNFWIKYINKIYNDNEYLELMKNRKCKIDLSEKNIFNKFLNVVENIKLKKERILEKKNIGILIPWADQGLGIQGREYYIELTKNGYNVNIMSFKPYKSNDENLLLQTEQNEWKYNNIFYYNKTREEIDLEDIIDFILKTNISTIIIPEICYEHIYYIVSLFKLFNIRCIGIPNIEIVRYDEIYKYNIFDVILCNNKSSLELLNHIKINTKIDYLGFNLNHNFIRYKKLKDKENIEFYCSGGFNSFIRKHINRICDVFNNIKIKNIKLYVYIQNKKVEDKIKNNYNENIIFIYKNQSYYEIIDMHRKHDIFIHMGSHEGLGLGFYEAIQVGTPVITINTTPNNEIIKENINGWLIKSTKYTLKDNDKSIIYGDKFDKEDLRKKIIEICYSFNKRMMYKKIKGFNNKLKNNNYINNLIKYL